MLKKLRTLASKGFRTLDIFFQLVGGKNTSLISFDVQSFLRSNEETDAHITAAL